ncbi:carbohydrate binding domain-containing protein [Robiginitalea aurantiaca]|uniref:Carbohydrate binding domain-containing protein n=1 Tax=Robiginitalea aurantiaca TaxID=3056915 RepID=A0ABT7WDU6_9FLAO|nr:carbohydrate binding domain-containing protein [Robiginitalea aurantiaca]MDM9631096.1 carbohydrate binding domain-containing protein [Robiginitalea aurantiaca]
MKAYGFYSLFFGIFLLAFSTVHSQNIITDGGFSLTTEILSDFEGPPPANIWWTWQDQNVIANASIVNEQLHYQIRSSGNQTFAVQMIQLGFPLEPGHSYRLSFDVKADSNRTFGVFLGENWGNWTSLIGSNNYIQNATTEWRKINIEFDVYTVFPEHKLSFDFGTINTNVYLDNVSLIDLGVIKEAPFAELSSSNKDVKNPGFRPESMLDQEFIDSYKESKFIIYPTIIRTPGTTTWSKSLSNEFTQNLNSVENLNLALRKEKLDPGELKGQAQYQFFQNDMERLGSGIKEKKENIDYYIIPEILFEPQREGTHFVFGIHLFILNNEGENAFSFLLNSHHPLFVEAKLYAYKPDENDIEALKQRSLEVAAQAFLLMVEQYDAQLN